MKAKIEPISFSALLIVILTAPASADVPTDQIGRQDFLVILSRFSGDVFGDTISVSLAETMMDSLNTWFEEVSYNHAALVDSAITSSTRKVVGWYTLPSDGTGNTSLDLNNRKALTAAVADPSSGITAANVGSFDRYIFCYAAQFCLPEPTGCTDLQQGSPALFQFTSTAVPANFTPFFGKRAWLYHFVVDAATAPDMLHEILHTYSLSHARSYSSIDDTRREYGNLFEVMGSHTVPLDSVPGTEIMPHIQAANKEFFGWIDTIPTISTSGSYKIGPLATALGVPNDNPRALKIDQKKTLLQPNNTRFYYLEFRRPIGLDNVPTGHRFNTYDGVMLLDVENGPFTIHQQNKLDSRVVDCTRETPIYMSYDAALPVGRSFTDRQVGICITPTAIVADTITVTVNVLADFPNNDVPTIQTVEVAVDSSGPNYEVTFDANVTDPDADILSYFWNFEVDLYKTRKYPNPAADSLLQRTAEFYTSGTFGSGETVNHTYQTNTPRRAYLIVSDRKGGETEWREIPLWGWKADTLKVGTGQTYTNISSAIAAATGGNVVLLRANASPYQGPTNANLGFDGKRIKLLGENTNVTIDPGGTVRPFVFDKLENGRAVVEGLKVKGVDVRTLSDDEGGVGVIRKSSRPVFQNCVFENGIADRGGAFFVEVAARGVFRQCTFRSNAATKGGGIYAEAGVDGVSATGGLTLDECTVVRNSATLPGGLHGGGVFYIEHNSPPEFSRLTIANTVIVQNAANEHGGGIYFETRRRNPLILGSSIMDNRSNYDVTGGQGHGIYFAADIDSVVITNCGVWDHWLAGPDYPKLISTFFSGDSSRVFLKSCLLRSWWDTGNGNVITSTGPGCVDPELPLGATDGDYSLGTFSLAVDAGRWINSLTARDRLLNPRYDDASVANTGLGTINYVDIGAFERQVDSGTKVTLTQELIKEGYRLVVGDDPPLTTYNCNQQVINVGRHSGAGGDVYTDRAFLDFSTTTIPDGTTIDKVELEIRVYEGMSGTVQFKKMAQLASGISCTNPTNLFTSITSSTLYKAEGGWNVTQGTWKTIILGSQANADLQARLGTGGSADGWFSVGIKAEVETSDEVMELYNSNNKLHVTYH